MAVTPYLTLGTNSLATPLSIAVTLKTAVPDLPKIIVVDVSLIEMGANACTTRYRAVDAYAGNADACHASKEVVAYLGLVSAQESLTGVCDPPFVFGR